MSSNAMSRFILLAVFAATWAVHGAESKIPDEQAIRAATEMIQSAYEREYKAARTNQAKVEFARKLLADAADPGNEPAVKYVLLRTAQDIAAAGGDVELACQAIDQLAQAFDVKPRLLQAEVLQKAGSNVDSSPGYERLMRLCYVTSQAALLDDDYSTADKVAEAAIATAKRLKDNSQLRRWSVRQKEMAKVEADFIRMAPMLAKLEGDPIDPSANFAVGKFRCFVQEDWARGVPLLALSSDERLAQVAVQELKQETPLIEIGDAWWAVGEGLEKNEKDAAIRRACHWYEQAWPKLTGLNRTRVGQRLGQTCGVQVPLKQRANGSMHLAEIDFASASHEVPQGRGFNPRNAWVLNVDIFAPARREGEQHIFLWGDDRNGLDPLTLWLNGNQIGATWTDCNANLTQVLAATLDPYPEGSWSTAQLHFDPLQRIIVLYLDGCRLAEMPVEVMSEGDKPMPWRLGGSPGHAHLNYKGKMRNFWLGNVD